MFSKGYGALKRLLSVLSDPAEERAPLSGRSFSERRHKICAAEIVSETNAVPSPAPYLTTVLDWHTGCTRTSAHWFILVRWTLIFRESIEEDEHLEQLFYGRSGD